MPKSRLAVLLSLAVVFLGVAVVFGVTRRSQETPNRVVTTGVAQVGGPFQLVDQDGRAVDQRLLQGKWSAVFFGYTSCPDVCPATLQALAAMQRDLGAEAKDLQVVFVSVDPKRDTPAAVKTYLDNAAFPAGAVGLTGTKAQVDAVSAAFKAPYQIVGDAGGDAYDVNHTSVVYLMNPQGAFVKPLGFGMPPAQMAEQVRAAMREA